MELILPAALRPFHHELAFSKPYIIDVRPLRFPNLAIEALSLKVSPIISTAYKAQYPVFEYRKPLPIFNY